MARITNGRMKQAKVIYDIAKILLSFAWVLIVANLFFEFPTWFAMILVISGLLLSVAHVAEYFYFREEISRKPEGAVLAFLLTFLFGLFYWKDPRS
jgi:uncharacterized protein YhhL (DUF1145 family)